MRKDIFCSSSALITLADSSQQHWSFILHFTFRHHVRVCWLITGRHTRLFLEQNDMSATVAPPTRATMDIIWSCTSTVILCVWTSLSTTVDVETNLRQKMCASAIQILAPELSVRAALGERQQASALRRTLKAVAGWEKWSLKQSFNTINDAVAMEIPALEHPETAEPEALETATLEHSETADPEALGTATLERKSRVLEPAMLVDYARSGELEFADMPTDTDIDKRSRADWFAKTISLLQVAWFLANTVSRLVSGYPISFLEDITITYVVSGAAIYCITWSSPQGIREQWHVTLRSREENGASECSTLSAREAGHFWGSWLFTQTILFTRIYVLAWYFPFPSLAETWLWRSASLALVTGFVVLMCLHYARGDVEEGQGHPGWAVLTTVGVCSLARLVLIIVAFTTLRKGSPGLYAKPAWSSYWAHIGN